MRYYSVGNFLLIYKVPCSPKWMNNCDHIVMIILALITLPSFVVPSTCQGHLFMWSCQRSEGDERESWSHRWLNAYGMWLDCNWIGRTRWIRGLNGIGSKDSGRLGLVSQCQSTEGHCGMPQSCQMSTKVFCSFQFLPVDQKLRERIGLASTDFPIYIQH